MRIKQNGDISLLLLCTVAVNPFLPFLFLFGISIGSFLNVVIDRLPVGKSPFRGRSLCESCGKTLSIPDLIPILSFVWLKGKCRYCKKKISFYYPVVELLTGILFVAVFSVLAKDRIIFSLSDFSQLLFYLFIVSVLIVVFFTDLKHGIIPDKIIFPSIVITFLYLALYSPALLTNHLATGIISFIFFFALILGTKGRGIGMGDAKLSLLIGIMLGFPEAVMSFYIAFLTGAGAGLILVLWGKRSLKGSLPFGPFLATSAIILLFFGGEIIPKIYRFLGL